ncbi:hypothetical protein DFR30_2784 [Thiogranum longum]|uniref:Glycosyltransferase 2-like domain-containing protein n=1 Tax=Thiogranum longum TaxID=1537524 RepID=A0A4R1HFK3_9GAMM|nr:glycosyltransferase family 2 protein [Thiogranum longum]TCK19473.1 hypothetical protein DFR30_2784 [Thiogranum longum]
MDLSIVIVEYHCMDQIDGCLPTLREYLADLEWECIVISNSEYEESVLHEYRTKFESIRLISNDRNRGYAGGVNRALRECKAPYVFVFNPDCRLLDSNMSGLLGMMNDEGDIAAIGPRVIYGDGSIQPSCRRFPRPWTLFFVRTALRKLPGAKKEKRRYLMEDFSHDSCRDVEWLSGGAILVRKAAIDDVGKMDERFFLYMEDVDWCKRFLNGGWRVVYAPVTTVCHDAQHDSLKGGLKRFSSPHVRYHLTSMAKYFLKHGLLS